MIYLIPLLVILYTYILIKHDQTIFKPNHERNNQIARLTINFYLFNCTIFDSILLTFAFIYFIFFIICRYLFNL